MAWQCVCFTCDKSFNTLGIARHRAMHRDRREDCEILYSTGITRLHKYAVIPNLKKVSHV